MKLYAHPFSSFCQKALIAFYENDIASGFVRVQAELYAASLSNPGLREEFLPRILNGTMRWCQGFSEPDNGSDLAATATRAVRDGDHYILNGAKIWTSLGSYAKYMILLARTDPPPAPGRPKPADVPSGGSAARAAASVGAQGPMAFMRMRSPSSAPPLLRREGSMEITAMRSASSWSSRKRRMSSSVRLDLPAPPVPVMPSTGT